MNKSGRAMNLRFKERCCYLANESRAWHRAGRIGSNTISILKSSASGFITSMSHGVRMVPQLLKFRGSHPPRNSQLDHISYNVCQLCRWSSWISLMPFAAVTGQKCLKWVLKQGKASKAKEIAGGLLGAMAEGANARFGDGMRFAEVGGKHRNHLPVRIQDRCGLDGPKSH